ncbi:hypothetical protein F2Q68_00021583, partial [Brassica cretica]
MEITFLSSCFRTLQSRVAIRRLQRSLAGTARETLARCRRMLRCKSLRLPANQVSGLRSFPPLMIARVIGKL